MKILIVIDQYDGANNGTTISARRFVKYLRKNGNTVKVLSTGEKEVDKYVLKEVKLIPIAKQIIKSQGMTFAKADKEILEKAIKEADIVHFYMPFKLSIEGMKIAQKLNKPMTAAFHVQPENITSTLKLGNNETINNKIYELFRDRFYNNFTHIHCPSNFIANQLKEHGYNAKLHVISNGIEKDFKYNKTEKPEEFKEKIIITMVGRLSEEKRQDLLIEAVKKSKYSEKIQLIYAGKGPKKRGYVKLGKALKNEPIFEFYKKEELKNILSFTSLYVHTADAEIEAISCIEAFATGLVPIIANSNKSATTQFAIDERSLFEAGNSNDLANKIDYWLDNEQERKNMEKIYADQAEKYRIENSIEKIEEMFKEEIDERRSERIIK